MFVYITWPWRHFRRHSYTLTTSILAALNWLMTLKILAASFFETSGTITEPQSHEHPLPQSHGRNLKSLFSHCYVYILLILYFSCIVFSLVTNFLSKSEMMNLSKYLDTVDSLKRKGWMLFYDISTTHIS